MNPFATGLAMLLALPQVHSAQASGEAGETDIIATGKDSAQRLTVPVNLGAAGPFRFLIDTGAQNTVVSNRLAARLALPQRAMARVLGVAGTTTVSTVEIEEIVLGRRSFFGLVAPVLDEAAMGAEGILGLDSLQDQRVLIDFRKGLMAVGDAKTLGGDKGYEIVVTARRRSGQLIVTDATLDNVRVQVVIDTGSDTTLGNRALQKAMGRKGEKTVPTTLYSVTGQTITADFGAAHNLRLPGATIANIALAYSASPTFAYLGLASKPALLLGMRELRAFPRVAIDFKTRKILFDLPEAGDPAYFMEYGGATRLQP